VDGNGQPEKFAVMTNFFQLLNKMTVSTKKHLQAAKKINNSVFLLNFYRGIVETHFHQISLDIISMVSLQHNETVFRSSAASKSALEFSHYFLHVANFRIDSFNQGCRLGKSSGFKADYYAGFLFVKFSAGAEVIGETTFFTDNRHPVRTFLQLLLISLLMASNSGWG
jgi:hypothetical protein